MRKFVYLFFGGSAIYEQGGQNLITHECIILDLIHWILFNTRCYLPCSCGPGQSLFNAVCYQLHLNAETHIGFRQLMISQDRSAIRDTSNAISLSQAKSVHLDSHLKSSSSGADNAGSLLRLPE